MSTETQELVAICEKLPAAQRAEVTDFARFLLTRNAGGIRRDVVDQWLRSAAGAAKAGVTTGEVLSLTRGEP